MELSYLSSSKRADSAAPSGRIRRSKDPPGYWVGDKLTAGFEDPSELPAGARRRIAAWAKAAGVASPVQLELLETPAKRKRSKAAVAAVEAASIEDSPIWAELTDAQREVVRHPENEIGSAYPLSTGQLADLAGISQDQVRHWDGLGFIRSRRSPGNHRLYYATALMTVLYYASLPQYVLSTLKALADDDSGYVRVAVQMTLGRIDAEAELESARPGGRGRDGRKSSGSQPTKPGRKVKPAAPKGSTKPPHRKTARADIEIMKVGGGWVARSKSASGEVRATSGVYATQREAAAAGKKIAKRAGKGRSQVVHKKDGRIATANTRQSVPGKSSQKDR